MPIINHILITSSTKFIITSMNQCRNAISTSLCSIIPRIISSKQWLRLLCESEYSNKKISTIIKSLIAKITISIITTFSKFIIISTRGLQLAITMTTSFLRFFLPVIIAWWTVRVPSDICPLLVTQWIFNPPLSGLINDLSTSLSDQIYPLCFIMFFNTTIQHFF